MAETGLKSDENQRPLLKRDVAIRVPLFFVKSKSSVGIFC